MGYNCCYALGKGGLGYKPYNIKGGFIIEKDENGNIINARPWTEDEKDRIGQDYTDEDDINELNKHKTMRKEYRDYLTSKFNRGEIDDDEAAELLDDFDNDVYFIEDNIEHYNEMSEKYKNIEEIDNEIEEIDNKIEESISPAEKIKLLKEELKLLMDKKEEIRKDTTMSAKQKDRKLKDNLEDIKEKTEEIENIQKGDNPIEPVKIDLALYAPEKYKFIKGLNKNIYNFDEKYYNGLVDVIKNLQTKYNTDGKNLIDFITETDFNAKIKPVGGGEATETAITDDRKIQSKIYKNAGFKDDIRSNPDMKNLKDIFLESGLFDEEAKKQKEGASVLPSLPIDLLDMRNNIFNEIKKYNNYSYEELKKMLYNDQLNPLKRMILENIYDVANQPNPSKKTITSLKKYIEDFTEEKDGKYIFDEKKLKKYYYDNYGDIGLPIGIQKFGNIGNFTHNKINPSGIYSTALKGLNENWTIDIDYNQKLPNGNDNPNYGKVVKLYNKDANGGMSSFISKGKNDREVLNRYNTALIDAKIIDKNGNLIKPFDYLFTIATKDKLVVLNYTNYVKKNKMNSPLDKFKLGEDFYNNPSLIKAKPLEGEEKKEEKKKYSYIINFEDFKEVPKSSFIIPKIKNTASDELLKSIVNETIDINKYDKKIKNRIKAIQQDKDFKTYQNDIPKKEKTLTKQLVNLFKTFSDSDLTSDFTLKDINNDNMFSFASKIKDNKDIKEKKEKYKNIVNEYKENLKLRSVLITKYKNILK